MATATTTGYCPRCGPDATIGQGSGRCLSCGTLSTADASAAASNGNGSAASAATVYVSCAGCKWPDVCTADRVCWNAAREAREAALRDRAALVALDQGDGSAGGAANITAEYSRPEKPPPATSTSAPQTSPDVDDEPPDDELRALEQTAEPQSPAVASAPTVRGKDTAGNGGETSAGRTIVARLQERARALGHAPTWTSDEALLRRAKRAFGSADAALAAAGLDRYEQPPTPKTWTREAIIEAIQRWAAAHGTPPSAKQWLKVDSEGGYPSSGSVYGRGTPFEKWSDAIEAAGFPPNKTGRPRKVPAVPAEPKPKRNSRWPSVEERRPILVAEIKALASALDRTPTTLDDHALYQRGLHAFGSWAEALKAAGLTPRPTGVRVTKAVPPQHRPKPQPVPAEAPAPPDRRTALLAALDAGDALLAALRALVETT